VVAKLRARVCVRVMWALFGIYCALLLMVMRYDERRKMSRLFAKGENRKMWKITKYTHTKEESLPLYIALHNRAQ